MSLVTRTLDGYGNTPPNVFCRPWVLTFNPYPANVENRVSSYYYSNILVYTTRCDVTQFIHIWKLLYMF